MGYANLDLSVSRSCIYQMPHLRAHPSHAAHAHPSSIVYECWLENLALLRSFGQHVKKRWLVTSHTHYPSSEARELVAQDRRFHLRRISVTSHAKMASRLIARLSLRICEDVFADSELTDPMSRLLSPPKSPSAFRVGSGLDRWLIFAQYYHRDSAILYWCPRVA